MAGLDDLDPMVVAAVALSVDRCLARHGATVPPPTSNRLATLFAYWSAAETILGNDLALQVAREIPVGGFGLASYGIVSTRTLGDALETLGRDYLERMLPGMRLRIVPLDRDQVEVRLVSEGDDALVPLLEEIVIAVIHRHLELLSTPPTIGAVMLRRPAPPAPLTAWAEFFGVRPRFGQRFSGARFAASDLQIPLRTASPELQAIVRSAGAQPEPSFAARARAHIRAHLRDPLDPAGLAVAMGVTERTLQRRLHEEQTSFRALADGVRVEVAREMLEHTDTSISEIAVAVGFTHAASFSRAFVRAMAETPQAYRKRHQD